MAADEFIMHELTMKRHKYAAYVAPYGL